MHTTKPPISYQEWLDCLTLLEGRRVRPELVTLVCQGSFGYDDALRAKFLQRLVQTLNRMLEWHTNRFLRQLETLLADGDLESIPLLCRRLKKELNCCCFFTRLEFLPTQERGRLSEEVGRQMRDFWKQLLGYFRQQAIYGGNSRMEDILFQLRRIKFFE